MGSEFAPGDLIDCVDQCPLLADFVAELGDYYVQGGCRHFLAPVIPAHSVRCRGNSQILATYAQQDAAGGGRIISLASLRRFCAIAAKTNSNWAPRGPRNRRRPSRRIRLRCANSISTRFLSWRDRSKASVFANDRATSRASS